MHSKFITQVLVFACLTSCSTKLSEYFSSEEKTNERNEELIKSFDVESNVLEKFKEKAEVMKSEVKIEQAPIVNETTKTKLIVKSKKTKNTISKKETPKQKKEVVKTKIQKLPKSQYPDDYPEDLIQLDNKTEGYWTSLKPTLFEGEEVFMDINYMGVSTGKIALTTKPITKLGEEDVYHFHARVKTSRYYSYLYDLDDNVDSYISTKNFLPVKFSLIQRESGQNIDDLQLFDSEKLLSYTFYKRETSKKTKKSKDVTPIPKRFQDPLSIVYFLRSLPFIKGKNYIIPIMNKGKVLTLDAHIEKIETLKTEIGTREAFKIIASTKYEGDTLKSGDMIFWFSTDERKIFLKFEAEIKIGSISGDIEKYNE